MKKKYKLFQYLQIRHENRLIKFQALEDKMQELEKGVQANNIEIKGQGRSSFPDKLNI